jgi:hypothetical protein
MQHQKHVEPRKKLDDEYDLKILIVINAFKKHLYVFFFVHDLMSITIMLAKKN